MREERDPNRAGGSASKRRAALGGLEGSPARKQQRKKPSKKDRRRVSFAPDPELTLVHHFVKDDDYTSNSDGQGRVVVAYDEDPTAQHPPPSAHHPALAGSAGVPDAGGSYRPGFWNKTVPENSPLRDSLPGLPHVESPGSVSMELTQPTVAVAAPRQPGEVTAGLPSLGALAEADELEGMQEEQQLQQHAAAPAAPGEVTVALPSLGALAEADEWEEEQPAVAAGSWRDAAEAACGNVTANITAALPALGALAEEDENATTGMDLTMPAGRVLEHHVQQQQQQRQVATPVVLAAAAEAAAPALGASPAPAAWQAAASPASAPPQQEQEQYPALAPASKAPVGTAELDPTAPVGAALRRRSSGGSDEVAHIEAAKAVLLNKWGFAPGQEDTLDINLEMHGRMIMGDQTFNRMYCDNTTGDSRYGGGRPAGDDTGDSMLVKHGAAEEMGEEGDDAAMAAAPAAVLEYGEAAVPSPAASHGRHQQAVVAPSPAAGAAAVAAVPNWTAPAFLPPYLQQAPANSGAAPSDHPALVHSPNVTGSSFNTLETRRVSVDMHRRASINSRRFSMQDATGRLLADDEDYRLHSPGLPQALAVSGEAAFGAASPAPIPALPPADAHASGGPHHRRRSSGAAFLARDVTEKLLVDDDSTGEDVGPLADLKRQMRMLSQGSPVLGGQPKAAKMAHIEAAASPGLQHGMAAAAQEAAAAEAAAAKQLPPAKTPRAAVSLGYADSHNPATMGLLRSGGTTGLLQSTVRLRQARGRQQDQEMAEAEEEASGEYPAAAAAAAAGDGGITARTNGTTKLLADMTMASVVGAKLSGRPAQGTPELGQAPVGDNLTGFSLDEFERPPELQAGQRQQQAGGAAEHDQLDAAMLEAGEQHYQQAPLADGYASPALAPAGGEFRAGYPVDAPNGSAAIPGGPKLHRTPVTVRAASQPRSAAGTPVSQARSLRSQHVQQLYQQATPGTHGMHRLARTPGSMRTGVVAYPIDADVTADNPIPGGPKLARTPVGRTPATGGLLAAPGSAVAQHYPGSARAVHFAAGPGSASLQRYPGSAVAHRAGGMTPQFAPPPMTFQDFAKLIEVQFLDNLRRGASINYADLQPNPVPANLAEAYRLLTIISPQVTTLENGIRILQEEVQARRVSAADAEQLVGQVNPTAFQKAQQADEEGLDVLRDHVGLLKRVCRQKAVYCLKDVRRQMEESRGARLRRNLEALRADLAFAQANREQMEGVAKAAEQFVAEQHRSMAQDDQARQEEAQRRTAVVGMRRALAEEAAANEQRRQRLQEVQERVAKLREEHAVLQREREALRSRTDALQVTLMQSQGQDALARESSPLAILQKLEELDVLKACVGWEVESAAEDPVSGEAALRLADLFRVRLNISRAGAAASVEMLPEGECKVPTDRRAMLASLAGCPEGEAAPEVRLAEASAAQAAALVQATTARLSRLADLAAELEGLRLAFPALTDIVYSPDGCTALSFVNLDAEVKFAVQLRLPACYPAGLIQQEAKIWFDGEGQITEQRISQAVAAAPEAPGRLRAICGELSRLAHQALPRPALPQDAIFHSNWQNPLFGSTPAMRT